MWTLEAAGSTTTNSYIVSIHSKHNNHKKLEITPKKKEKGKSCIAVVRVNCS